MMTPEDFDLAYFKLAQLLGSVEEPDLVRDRLLLLLVQKVSLDDLLDVLDRAPLASSEVSLKKADAAVTATEMAHR